MCVCGSRVDGGMKMREKVVKMNVEMKFQIMKE